MLKLYKYFQSQSGIYIYVKNVNNIQQVLYMHAMLQWAISFPINRANFHQKMALCLGNTAVTVEFHVNLVLGLLCILQFVFAISILFYFLILFENNYVLCYVILLFFFINIYDLVLCTQNYTPFQDRIHVTGKWCIVSC